MQDYSKDIKPQNLGVISKHILCKKKKKKKKEEKSSVSIQTIVVLFVLV